LRSSRRNIPSGHGLAGFTRSKLPRYGFLTLIHEARTDFTMGLGLVFILIAGAVGWSVDAQARGEKSTG
jgi:hypothetical protein